MKDIVTPSKFRFKSAAATDLGLKRKQNQDRILCRTDLGLFVVADGMGGHQGGETASRICCEITDTRQLLIQAIQRANQFVFEAASNSAALQGMGTTVSALLLHEKTAWIAQVGDSRAYFYNQDGLWQLTRDHSMVQEKLRAGLITREQLKSDQMRNVITRSIGVEPNIRIDLFEFPIQSGDGFLLCSDGLTGPLEDSEIFDTLGQSTSLTNQTAQQLIQMANARGGDDNISVVIVNLE
jgi:PPM family protein phosphatase